MSSRCEELRNFSGKNGHEVGPKTPCYRCTELAIATHRFKGERRDPSSHIKRRDY